MADNDGLKKKIYELEGENRSLTNKVGEIDRLNNSAR